MTFCSLAFSGRLHLDALCLLISALYPAHWCTRFEAPESSLTACLVLRLAQRLFHTELVAQLHAGLKSMPEGLAHLLADSTPEDAPPALQHWCSRLQAVQAQQCEAAGSNPAGSPDGVFAADLPPLLANPGDSRAPDLACRLYIDQALDAEGRQWDHVLSAQAAEVRTP